MEWTKDVDNGLILSEVSEVSEAKIELFIFIGYEIRIFEPLNLKKFGWSKNVKNEFSQKYCTYLVYWGKLQKKKFQKRSRRSIRKEGRNRREITKVKGKKVKNEFSHWLPNIFLSSLLR